MAPTSDEFQNYLTAKLWTYLENPDSFSMDNTPSTEMLLREFKAKWIGCNRPSALCGEGQTACFSHLR